MKINLALLLKISLVFSLFLAYSCSGNDKNKEQDPAAVNEEAIKDEENKTASNFPKGEQIYVAKCEVCHQKNGEGISGSFPPLAKSDFLLNDKSKALSAILNGLDGEITVNGEKYNTLMPAFEFTDEESTDIMNYILDTWGNNGGKVDVVNGKL
jgi:mono/diheme cytochrome c family protein